MMSPSRNQLRHQLRRADEDHDEDEADEEDDAAKDEAHEDKIEDEQSDGSTGSDDPQERDDRIWSQGKLLKQMIESVSMSLVPFEAQLQVLGTMMHKTLIKRLCWHLSSTMPWTYAEDCDGQCPEQLNMFIDINCRLQRFKERDKAMETMPLVLYLRPPSSLRQATMKKVTITSPLRHHYQFTVTYPSCHHDVSRT